MRYVAVTTDVQVGHIDTDSRFEMAWLRWYVLQVESRRWDG